MTAAFSIYPPSVERLERNRDPLHNPSPEMEATMFETLMKFGGHRVDYMNSERAGSSVALGLYVSGDLPAHQSYSRAAKHALMSGLVAIREQGEERNLVAVYLDIDSGFNPNRPAYQQMKYDVQAGLFHRLFVPIIANLAANVDLQADFWKFYRSLPRIELLSIDSGMLCPQSYPQQSETYLFSAV